MAKTGARPRRSLRKTALWTIVGLIALFVLIQFVPYGRDHTNPPATDPFTWTSPRAEAIARESCYDCHSNETTWWWAVKIAPFSWLARHDIDGAREVFNFSEWNGSLTPAAMQAAINDNMPPLQFTLLHPGAKLSDAEKQTLVQGFESSLAGAGATGSPTPSPTPTPSSSATAPAGDAASIITARCASCHSTGRALQFHAASADEAKALIDQMVQRGATVSAAEEQTLIAYFTR